MELCESLTTKNALPRLISGKPLFQHWLIIAGDPRRPDKVKPSGSFTDKEQEDLQQFMAVVAGFPGYQVTLLDNHDTLIEDLIRIKPDIVINLCDNGYRNDARLEMHIPALLELLNIPYTGATPKALQLAYDKFFVSQIARAMAIATPKEISLSPDESLPEQWNTYPAFIKPRCADNSYGILGNAICNDRTSLLKAIAQLHRQFPHEVLLIQEFLSGKEYRITMLGNARAGYYFMPIAQRDFSDSSHQFITYEYKYDIERTREQSTIPTLNSQCADIPENILVKLKQQCIQLANSFECFDFVVFDFREDNMGIPKLIDLNPNPSWDIDALICDYDVARGYQYRDVIRLILESAQLRYMGETRQEQTVQSSKEMSSPVAKVTRPLPLDETIRLRTELKPTDAARLASLAKSTGVLDTKEVDSCRSMCDSAVNRGSDACGYYYLIAERGEDCLGFTCYGDYAISDTGFELYWIVLNPAAQGSGLAVKLFQETQRLIQKQGGSQLYTETSSTQAFAPARRLYDKMGMKLIAVLPDFFRAGDDKFIYHKDLTCEQQG